VWVAGFALEIDHDVGAVVVGFDRHFNYYKIQYAQLAINELGVREGVRLSARLTGDGGAGVVAVVHV
jgi:hypothetical protein